MLDGAPSHIGLKVQKLLGHHFTDLRVSIVVPTSLATRSPDLTPSDFWRLAYLSYKVSLDNNSNLNTIKDSITYTVTHIPCDMLYAATENALQSHILNMAQFLG